MARVVVVVPHMHTFPRPHAALKRYIPLLDVFCLRLCVRSLDRRWGGGCALVLLDIFGVISSRIYVARDDGPYRRTTV